MKLRLDIALSFLGMSSAGHALLSKHKAQA